MSGQTGLFLPEFSVDPGPPSPGGLASYDGSLGHSFVRPCLASLA